MNLANKLTVMRVVMVPIFLVFMEVEGIPLRFLWALVVFAAASVTDMLDGKIARKYNMVTSFGKFLDPLADKILVASALVCFVGEGCVSAWIVAVILMREFAVSGVRLVAASSDKKVVVPANIWGKLKTAFTMAAIALILVMLSMVYDFGLMEWGTRQELFCTALMVISAAITVISGVIYIYECREFIDPSK